MRLGEINSAQATQELGMGKSRLYEIYSQYLQVCARGHQYRWKPKVSGGNHRRPWSPDIQSLIVKLLVSDPPCSYALIASEVHRRHGIKLDRATIRRWAVAHGKAHDTSHKLQTSPVRRWQVQQIGQIWQYDASPHRWLPDTSQKHHLLQCIDDHSRLITGARLYARENLSAHMDFLSRIFQTHGLPVCLYVDYHSFFWTHTPEALTQLGQALAFYEISLKYAPTPQAKGKIERSHQTWQNRLPALFKAENISNLSAANDLLSDLLLHHNTHHLHREIQMTPRKAWLLALKEKRSLCRPLPRCPWWPYVWSIRSTVRVGSDGRVPVGTQRLRVEYPHGHKLIHCAHPNGDITILKDPPAHQKSPIPLLHCSNQL